MKNIVLLRHAKSSWKDLNLSDFDRPLNKRGRRDAPDMAGRLLKRGLIPDLIISSSAQRTYSTAVIFRDILECKCGILKSQDLYEAPGYEIIRFLRTTDKGIRNLLVVCHNPGITDAANYLTNKYFENIPTCGMAGFEYRGEWNDLTEKSCNLIFYDYPKKT